jgi:hypothetical protein
LCSCGTRGSNYFGIQFAKWIPVDKLPALVEQLRALPWASSTPTRTSVLEGDNLVAVDDPDTDHTPDGTSYLYDPGTGQTFPLLSKDDG